MADGGDDSSTGGGGVVAGDPTSSSGGDGSTTGGGSSGGDSSGVTGGDTSGEESTGATTSIMPEPTPRLLLMTKTEGYRHDSIPAGISAVQGICDEQGWELTTTEDASLFTDEQLATFTGVMFLSTSGDILSPEQEAAFRGFVEAGGSFIGVHAATDTEPGWQWYRELVGAHFHSHPAIQSAQIHVDVADHLATAHLSDPWLRADEWYNFDVNPRADETVNVLLTLDEGTYMGGNMGDHPITWTREVGPSRMFYTALGHTTTSYAEPEFLLHLSGGMRWALQGR